MEVDSPIPVENFADALTHRLPQDIAVIDACRVSGDFDVIGNVDRKLYRYSIFTGRSRPVLNIRHCWHLPVELNTDRMNEAASLLAGKKDFKSFASAADQRESSVRTVFRCGVSGEGRDWIYIDVEGDGFLYNMVRNITGTLTEVGRGKLFPRDMEPILKARDRTAAGPIAPPQGLCLMWIKY